MGKKKRHEGWISVRRFSNSRDSPIKRHAEILMKRVPKGKCVPIRADTTVPTQKRVIAPNEPPKAMKKYFCNRMLSSIKKLDWI